MKFIIRLLVAGTCQTLKTKKTWAFTTPAMVLYWKLVKATDRQMAAITAVESAILLEPTFFLELLPFWHIPLPVCQKG